ncbi:MAG: hypothetical protein WC781_01085 [Candidatus Pacearchaeota archaeon]|jgi:hypothetical protein
MSESDDESNLVRLVVSIGEKKKDLRIEGLNNVHPIYEATAALLQRHLQDSDIHARFVKDENSLREVIATEALLDYLPDKYKQPLKNQMKTGSPLKEIVSLASLYISEDKRTQDGKPLNKVSSSDLSDKYFRKAITKSTLSEVYIQQSEMESLRTKAKELKQSAKSRLISYAVGGSVLTLLALGGYYMTQ